MDYNQKLRGLGVALITPFKNREIDFEGFGTIINHVIEGGVDYILPLGSTGEAANISDKEKRLILDEAIKVNNRRVPLVAGNFGGNNTRSIIDQIKSYNFNGIDAILSASPEYVKPTQEGIYEHYMALAAHSPVPIIIYNVPGRTSSNITPETTIKLANDSDKFIGFKAASGDLVQATHLIKNKPDHFFVSSGDDPTALALIAIGGDGCISVLGNVFPRQFATMIQSAKSGDFEKARNFNNLTFDLHHWMYVEGNPTGVKAAAEILGLCSREVRLPLMSFSEKNKSTLKEEIAKISK